MSVLLTKVLWFKVRDRRTENFLDNLYQDPTNITDAIDFNVGKGLSIQNNTLTLKVKNPPTSSTNQRYVDTDGNILFEEQDQIKIFAKYSDDGADINSGVWDDNTTEPSPDDLISIFYVIEFKVQHDLKSTFVQLTCADKTYVIFSRTLARAFFGSIETGTTDSASANKLIDSGQNFTESISPYMLVDNTTDDTQTYVTAIDSDTQLSLADDIMANGEAYNIQHSTPSMVQKVVRFGAENKTAGKFIGDGPDAGVRYDIDAKMGGALGSLSDDNGYITSIRRSATEDNDITNTQLYFPHNNIAKVWKPISEWINELSQPEFTNTTSELSGTDTDGNALTYGRPFIFWIDENDRFHWIYPTDDVDSILVVGTDKITDVKLTKKVFDITNMVIYNAGEDMYKVGITGYVVDPTSEAKTLKMTYIPMTDISEKWIEQDYKKNTTREGDVDWGNGVTKGKPFPQFVTDVSYPVTPSWSPFSFGGTDYTTATNDATYNTQLREKCKLDAENRSSNILAGIAHPRWKGNIELIGQKFNAGDLIDFTDAALGINQEKLRIMDVKHNFNKTGWFVTITVEKDVKAIQANA